MKQYILIVLFLILICSCRQKRYVYLQKTELEQEEKDYLIDKPDYVLQPHDILYINVKSPNEEINNVFNKNTGRGQGMGTGQTGGSNSMGGSFYFSGYHINDTGYVEIPLLGAIKIEDYTLNDARKIISDYINSFVENTIVDVKLISFNILFFGEIGSPGLQRFMQEEVTIYEAITQAGGVTDAGNRQKILIIRKEKDRFKTMRVDLTKRHLLSSERLYLLPNDMVYVEPRRTQLIKMDTQELFFYISTITSLVSTTILVLAYVK